MPPAAILGLGNKQLKVMFVKMASSKSLSSITEYVLLELIRNKQEFEIAKTFSIPQKLNVLHHLI